MDVTEARRLCLAQIEARDSILCREARLMGGRRLDLFMASYMAMRLIDDQMDDASVGRPSAAAIDRWLARVGEAADGRFVPAGPKIGRRGFLPDGLGHARQPA